MARYLLDTNVLLRTLQPESEQRSTAIRAISALATQGDLPCITPQVLIEMWAVATRSVEANGFGWSPDQALAEVRSILERFPILEDTADIFPRWVELVGSHGISGKRVHDARLVAVMQAHGIKMLLTFDTGDFSAYEDLVLIHPADLS